ncbi:MAG TPA: hypothetical protein DCQ32_07765, partial [Cyanobacteria bacterium UBA8156]|nr:hypothetical protein [Cyanobacteria bacterium UBA8156]
MTEQQADELYAQAQWEEAAALYAQLIAETRDPPALWFFRLGACRMEADPAAAIAHFARAVATDPGYVKAYINWALLCHRQGDVQRADDLLRQALVWEPENPILLGNRVPVLLDLGGIAEAIAAGEQAIAHLPPTVTPYLNLARALVRAGQRAAAIACLQTAHQRFPQNGDVLFGLGELYQQALALEPAIAAFQAALRCDPAKALFYEGLGQAYVVAHRFDLGVVALQEAVRREPTAARWAALGNALGHQDNLPAAIAAWEQAHALDPRREEDLWRSRLALPAVYESAEAYAAWGERFRQNHRDWAEASVGRDRTDPVAALGYSFYLPYRGEDVLPWLGV